MIAEKVIYIPDTHVPYQDEQAVETALKMVHWYKPDMICFLGDFLDYAPLSRYMKDSVSERAATSMQAEFEAGNRLFDRFTKYCQNVVYLDGNHESRYQPYTDQHPEVRGLVEPEKGLEFSQRRKDGYKIRHFRYNECFRNGNLYATHGWYTNQHHAQKHVNSFCRNVVYGHIHDVQVATAISPIDQSRKHMAVCLGCLCNRSPEYMRNAPNKWVHCLGIAHFRKNGDFNLDPVVISDGVASYAGKVFSS